MLPRMSLKRLLSTLLKLILAVASNRIPLSNRMPKGQTYLRPVTVRENLKVEHPPSNRMHRVSQ